MIILVAVECHCKPQKSIKMNSKVIIGFLMGALVGGALGILLAPDKGSETRKKIIEKGNDIGDSISEFGGTVKDKFNQMVNGARGGVDA
jgi:gas vesicle protein